MSYWDHVDMLGDSAQVRTASPKYNSAWLVTNPARVRVHRIGDSMPTVYTPSAPTLVVGTDVVLKQVGDGSHTLGSNNGAASFFGSWAAYNVQIYGGHIQQVPVPAPTQGKTLPTGAALNAASQALDRPSPIRRALDRFRIANKRTPMMGEDELLGAFNLRSLNTTVTKPVTKQAVSAASAAKTAVKPSAPAGAGLAAAITAAVKPKPKAASTVTPALKANTVNAANKAATSAQKLMSAAQKLAKRNPKLSAKLVAVANKHAGKANTTRQKAQMSGGSSM